MRGGKLVEITEERRNLPVSVAPAIWGEITPYQFMGESHRGRFEMVESRTRHKELLREGGYIEVGNEKPKSLRGNNV